MKSTAAVLLVLALSVTARAEFGEPNRAVLDDMGLAGLQTMSDAEGLAVRGLGKKLKDRPPSAKMLWYLHGVATLHEHIGEFETRLAGHSFSGAGRFSDGATRFHSNVAKFQGKIGW